jgi:GTP-binding protein EngB required for normal cell division
MWLVISKNIITMIAADKPLLQSSLTRRPIRNAKPMAPIPHSNPVESLRDVNPGNVHQPKYLGLQLKNIYPGPRDPIQIPLPPSKKTINIIIFGETDVGKSSVINLIAGKEIAKVSSDVDGCTMASTPYNFILGQKNIRIFDTVGLEDPQMGFNAYFAAIEKAYQLILSLSEASGVHLLLFCRRGGRVTATDQSNYRMFREFLCNNKVPVALVLTGLEREVRMENWWERNESNVEKYGIRSIGHACITAARGDTPGQAEKYAISQKTIRELLMNYALEDDPFLLESQNWLVMVARRMMGLIVKRGIPKRKDIVKVLTKRCDLDVDTARRVAGLILAREEEADGGSRSPAPTSPWLKFVKAIRGVDGPGNEFQDIIITD